MHFPQFTGPMLLNEAFDCYSIGHWQKIKHMTAAYTYTCTNVKRVLTVALPTSESPVPMSGRRTKTTAIAVAGFTLPP